MERLFQSQRILRNMKCSLLYLIYHATNTSIHTYIWNMKGVNFTFHPYAFNMWSTAQILSENVSPGSTPNKIWNELSSNFHSNSKLTNILSRHPLLIYSNFACKQNIYCCTEKVYCFWLILYVAVQSTANIKWIVPQFSIECNGQPCYP